jgi:hypothetical protein
MKKIWIGIAVIITLSSAYFAFVHYTILSVFAIVPIIIFLIESRKNKFYFIITLIPILILLIGMLRTYFGMG